MSSSPPIDPQILALATHLHRELRPAWTQLQRPQPWPLEEAATPPADGWTAASWPASLQGRRCELIVEASDGAAIEAGLHSGADAVVLDLDDVFSPRHGNLERAYRHFQQVAARPFPLLTRVRPLAHQERRVLLDGAPAIAGLLDLAAWAWCFRERETVLYLPKLDTLPEAALWRDALQLTERWLGRPAHSLRVCLQIETLPGLLQAGALLHTLRDYAYGLNAGRWDYVFSCVKHRPEWPFPERARLGMDQPSMQAYARQIVAVCRQYGAEPVGGTAAVAPDPHDPGPALAAVLADKQREARQGYTSAWAGLPELVGSVQAGFQGVQVHPELSSPTRDELLDIPAATSLPDEAAQDAIGVALAVFAAWLDGRGYVARLGRIEDTATAELSRALLWNWVRHGLLTEARYLQLRRTQADDEMPAARLLDRLVLNEACAPYFPEVAEAMVPEAPDGTSPL
ncbi:malate synthase A [Deinococcus sonorensis]|uniref:malate synthase n=2 Tax=Deinococcus sonorensis TaxID=309891 RepID=A0AAU7UF52_9DEIO